jgi:hypothetical protein
MMNDLHDMIRVSCEEAITPDTEAQMEHEAQQAEAHEAQQAEAHWANQAALPEASYREQHGRCEDAPCCGCCGGGMEDGYGSPADDAWHDANEYPDW